MIKKLSDNKKTYVLKTSREKSKHIKIGLILCYCKTLSNNPGFIRGGGDTTMVIDQSENLASEPPKPNTRVCYKEFGFFYNFCWVKKRPCLGQITFLIYKIHLFAF